MAGKSPQSASTPNVRERKRLFDDDFLSRLESLRLAAKRMTDRASPGQRRGVRLGDGLEFADHRDYAAGDDVRYIDWPYFGRMERLLLRLFHEHNEGAVTILLDVSGSMALGREREVTKFDYARRAAGALAYLAMGGLEQVRLHAFGEMLGDPLMTGRNRGQIITVLDWLAGLYCAGPTNLSSAVEALVRRGHRMGMVIIISDLLGCQDDLDESLARLRAGRQDTVVMQVTSPADAEPEVSGPLLLAEAESDLRQPVFVTDAMLESYRKTWAAFLAGCQRTTVARGATYVPTPTTKSLDMLVLHTIYRAGIIGK